MKISWTAKTMKISQKAKKRWKYLKRQCRARDRILCDHSSGFGFATSLPSRCILLALNQPPTLNVIRQQIASVLSSTNSNVESVGGGTPHPSCNLQMGSAGSCWGQIMEAKWGNRWKQWVEAQMMRGTKRWALQIGPPTPCQAAQFANWVWTHSWQRAGTDYLVHNCFHGLTLLKGSRKKCNFFTFSQDVRVSRSPLLLVRGIAIFMWYIWPQSMIKLCTLKRAPPPPTYLFSQLCVPAVLVVVGAAYDERASPLPTLYPSLNDGPCCCCWWGCWTGTWRRLAKMTRRRRRSCSSITTSPHSTMDPADASASNYCTRDETQLFRLKFNLGSVCCWIFGCNA